ncbi:MAG: GH92 family glycosyl hydrolase [Bryobacteraceae bacterium]
MLVIPALMAMSFGALAQTKDTTSRPRHAELVNVFTGTSNSRWMQFPGATVPMGLVKMSPDNQGNVWNGGYEYTIASVSGFSFLHSFGLSGMSVMPLNGPIENEPGQAKLFPGPSDGPFGGMWTAGYRSRIRKDTEIGKPGYYAVDLVDAKTRVELTATVHTGWMRFQFPAGNQTHLLFDFAAPVEEKVELIGFTVKRVSATEIEGSLTQRNGYAGKFTVYFVTQFSQAFAAMNSWQTGEYTGADTNYGVEWRKPRTTRSDVTAMESKGPGGIWLDFATLPATPVVARTGISLTGLPQARENLQSESAPYGFDFDAVAQAANASWDQLLHRVDIEGGSKDDQVKFYTNLYRVYSAKAILDDVDGSYRDACGEVRKIAPPADHLYSSDALWGTQWTLGPVWSLLAPEVLTSFDNALLFEASRDGWLPEAPVALRYSPVMAGQHEIALLVGALQKGLPGIDRQAAYEAVRHVLTTPGEPYTCGGSYPQGMAGDRHLAAYRNRGYVPEETGPASSTFEYAYDDSCAAALAASLGKKEDAAMFSKRSENWRNGLSPETAYAQRRHADGSWVEPNDIHRFGTVGGWNGPGFVEGTPWIYSWFVPQDVPGLVETVGKDRFNQRLQEGFERQYVDLTNEPNLQAPWLFNYSGKAFLTQRYARHVFGDVFDTSPLNGWPGEEDEGQMGAYVVLAGIGLFDMEGGCTAEPSYQISGPAFSRVVLHFPAGNFEIVAHGNSPVNLYIQTAVLNGVPLKEPRLKHSQLAKGGKLVLEMGPNPSRLWE